MTNADDICGELAAARAYITRGDYQAALEAIDQATRLWSAERDYWAWVENESAKSLLASEIKPGLVATQPTHPLEQPVVWAKRHESIHAAEDDWRSHGIA